jgi:hypothetical protein
LWLILQHTKRISKVIISSATNFSDCLSRPDVASTQLQLSCNSGIRNMTDPQLLLLLLLLLLALMKCKKRFHSHY